MLQIYNQDIEDDLEDKLGFPMLRDTTQRLGYLLNFTTVVRHPTFDPAHLRENMVYGLDSLMLLANANVWGCLHSPRLKMRSAGK